MSIKINMITPNKTEMAGIFRAIAEDIQASGNDTITVDLELTYNKSKKKECK